MKHSKLLVCIAIALSVALLFSGCSSEVLKYNTGTVVPSVQNGSLAGHSGDYSAATKTVNADTALYYDKNSFSIAACYASGRLWKSLPSEENSSAAVFYLTAIFNGKQYELNSQDNSVSLGGAAFNSENGTLTADYSVYPDAAKAFSIELTLVFSVKNGRMTVRTDTNEWKVTEGVCIRDFSLLPWFGAIKYDSVGVDPTSDYFCVPDGSGGLIYTKKDTSSLGNISFDVYTGSVLAPVFGVMQDNAGFSCVTVGGDEALNIICNTAGQYKTIYNKFILAEPDSSGKSYYESYSGELCSVYSFIEGSRPSFADISSAARSVFLEYGLLSSSVSSVCHPAVKLICRDENGKKLTDTDSAQLLLGLLKGKGIDNVNFILEGALKEGTSGSTSRFDSSVCPDEGLQELCSYASAQGSSVFASAYKRTSSSKAAGLKNTAGEKVQFATDSGRFVINSSVSGSQMKKIFAAVGKYGLSGLCIEDASADIFASSKITASGLRNSSSALCETLSGSMSVITAGGYFCTAGNSTELTGVPTSPLITNAACFADEPFILAILHGCVEYTSTPVNTAEIPKLAMLRCIEYGASPCVEWGCLDGESNYYENKLTDYTDFLVGCVQDLGDLTQAEITDHYSVRDGVFCTEYDSKTLVYVNYNNVSAVLGDIVIPPYDYLRLN